MTPRALVVDDDASIRRVVTRMLVRLGFEVDVASCGADAAKAAGEHRFTVVLLDMQLPDLDGPVTAGAIRAASGASPPPILIMSGGMEASIQKGALEAGAQACLAKPFTLEALRGALRPWLAAPATAAPASTLRDPDPTPLLDVAAGDHALFTRLIETFLRDADKHVTAFEAATEAGDAHGARRRMHQLFGAAAMVGAPGLSAIARKLHDGAADDANRLALRAELARVTASFRALLDR